MADPTDKIQLYREMLRLDPSSRIFEILAEELYASGEWEEAEMVCREGIRFHPDKMRPRVLLALTLMELGNTEQCERMLLDIYSEISNNSIIFKLLSDVASSANDPVRAGGFSRIHEAFESIETPREERTEERPKAATQARPITREQFELILSKLAERVEARLAAPATLPDIFSKTERDFLKKTVLAELEAVS
ncbi:MAG: hypothetical protein ABFD97_21705 [Syntrophobacter sp.]